MRWIALQALAFEPSYRAGSDNRHDPGFQPAGLTGVALQRALGAIALGFTPRVTLLDEAVLMEVSCSLRLFGGLRRLAALLEQELHPFLMLNTPLAKLIRAQGASSLIALARLRLVAQQLGVPNSVGELPSRVGCLPMHTLSAARPHLPVLERTGCQTWDDLLNLPRDGVARRFGAPLLAALDRARGVLADSYTWLTLPEQFEEKLELDALVVHAPALMAGVSPLLAQLQAWLLGRQSGLLALKLTWYLDKRRDVPATGELVVRTANPAQDLRHTTSLVMERLNQQALPAPVHSLRLQSLLTEKLEDAKRATTSLLPEEKQTGDSAQQLMERLSARLGNAQVQTWQACADHRPERMQLWRDALNATGANASKVTESAAMESRATRAHIHWAKGINDSQNRLENGVLYPSWLLPEPLRLTLVAGSPVYQGPLVRLAGPQRLEATGWHAAGAASGSAPPAIRDYFIYRSQRAGLLWIYSERQALETLQTQPAPATASALKHWYLHGFFA
jgi:protein ImuB